MFTSKTPKKLHNTSKTPKISKIPQKSIKKPPKTLKNPEKTSRKLKIRKHCKIIVRDYLEK